MIFRVLTNKFTLKQIFYVHFFALFQLQLYGLRLYKQFTVCPAHKTKSLVQMKSPLLVPVLNLGGLIFRKFPLSYFTFIAMLDDVNLFQKNH